MVCLPHHASRRAQKYNIGRDVGAVGGAIERIAVDANGETVQCDRHAKDAIVAPNETHVVLVQPQVIVAPQDQRGRRSGRAGTEKNLETHAWNRAGAFAQASGLEAAASSVKSLAALVVGPSAAGIDVIQYRLAHDHLAARAAQHGSTPAARFLAGRLAHADLERVAIVQVFAVHRSVFPFPDFIAAERITGETTEAHSG